MDMDLNAPAFITPVAGDADVAAGAAPATLLVAVAVDYGDPPRRRAEDGPSTGRSFEVDGSPLPVLPRARVERPIGDHQVLAAAELIRRGFAHRIVLTNASIDSSLPEDCQVRGVPIHLERLEDGRTRVTAGHRRP